MTRGSGQIGYIGKERGRHFDSVGMKYFAHEIKVAFKYTRKFLVALPALTTIFHFAHEIKVAFKYARKFLVGLPAPTTIFHFTHEIKVAFKYARKFLVGLPAPTTILL